MQADPAHQRRLLELLEIDTAIAQRKHQAQSLPELAQLAELRTLYQAVSDEVVAANTAVGDAKDAVARVEGDLEPARQRLERNQQRVDDGSIGDQKALRSMIEEIDHLTVRIRDLEDAELDALQTLEDETTRAEEATSRKAELEGRARELMKARDEALAGLKAEVSELLAERKKVTEAIDAPLVGLYDKLRERTGVGVGRLDGARCTACGLVIDPTTLRTYEAAAASEVLRCEECDRILVRG